MKKTFAIAALIMISITLAYAQTKDEQEVLKFIADYDQAFVNQDIAHLESILADDYVFSSETGATENRAQSLEEARKNKANPKGKTLSFKSVNDTLRVVGNVATVSGAWTSSVVPITNLQAEPHIDKGRYTMVLEKRSGKRMVIAEHFSEAPHDNKIMETMVAKAGQEYGKILTRQDKPELERLFADEYVFTNENGKTRNKDEDIAVMTSPDTKIQFESVSDQKVQVFRGNLAIETGTYKAKGTVKGKPFEETGRYTTTWIWRDLRWQIIADHISLIK